MEQDSIKYDSTISARPLPQWLINQKEGLNTYQPPKIIMKEDNSLKISFGITGILILLFIAVLTIYILRKDRKKSQ